MIGDELFIEIDTTLDRLIRNAEAITGTDISTIPLPELEAFQKTQESLIHHLIYVDQKFLEKKKNIGADRRSSRFKIQEKRAHFEKLKESYQKIVDDTIEEKLPIQLKRRKKKFLVAG